MPFAVMMMERCPEDAVRLVGLTPPASPRPAGGYPVTKKGTRRCLFGPVDHQQNKRELERIKKSLDDRDNSIWNFDFANCTPCSGRFMWEKVSDSENSTGDAGIPEAYRLPHLDRPAVSYRFLPLGVRSCSPSPLPNSGQSSRGQSPLTLVRPLGELDTNTDRCPSPLTVTSRSSSRGQSPLLEIRPSTPVNSSRPKDVVASDSNTDCTAKCISQTSSSSSSSSQSTSSPPVSRKRKQASTQTKISEFFPCCKKFAPCKK